jgi:hypothetical protein
MPHSGNHKFPELSGGTLHHGAILKPAGHGGAWIKESLGKNTNVSEALCRRKSDGGLEK